MLVTEFCAEACVCKRFAVVVSEFALYVNRYVIAHIRENKPRAKDGRKGKEKGKEKEKEKDEQTNKQTNKCVAACTLSSVKAVRFSSCHGSVTS